MPYILEDLIVDRVDLVDEGANSAAFIEICKRKEQTNPMDFSEILSKMKPEHSAVVQAELDKMSEELSKARGELETANATISEQEGKLNEANEALAKANEELETYKTKEPECNKEENEEENEEDVLKAMPENIREEFLKMRAQKEAAEEQVRKNEADRIEAEAVAKAATLKSIPVEQATLVNVLKNCDKTIEEILVAAAAAIDGTVLTEVGKSGEGKPTSDAWSKIESEAEKVAKRDSITKQKAIAVVIKEQPELYREYLNGGN